VPHRPARHKKATARKRSVHHRARPQTRVIRIVLVKQTED
jgi:hypothetical protein